MKIIEALKNLKTIQKRIDKNCEQIRQYCAYVNVEQPPFKTPELQKQEVDSLLQANLDLEKEYLKLKKAIEHTNLNVKVIIGHHSYTITELISLKRVAGQFRTKTYNALNQQIAQQKLQEIYRRGVDGNNPAKIISLYSEADKNKSLREWDEFLGQIDGKLEVVNAETELALSA